MNWLDLTKDKKQYIVLASVVGVVVVALLYFGIHTETSSMSKTKEELEELTKKIEKSDQTLEKRSLICEDYEKSISQLKLHIKNMPPKKNYYSWATEIVYETARSTALEVDGVDEANAARPKTTEESAGEEISLESYELRIIAHGGYEDVKEFLLELKRRQPLVRYTGIEINKGQKLDVHDIQLSVEWPFNLSDLSATWERIEKKREDAGIHSGTPPVATHAQEPSSVQATAVKPVSVIAKTPGTQVKPKGIIKPKKIEKASSVAKPLPEKYAGSKTRSSAPRTKAKPKRPNVENTVAQSTSNSANKLESLLENQSQKNEASWNAFIGTLQGENK